MVGNNANIGLYAGNGDGTFQTTPFYTPVFTTTYDYVYGLALVSVGDVNADGHPDLLLKYGFPLQTSYLGVFLGDGTGNFSSEVPTL